MTVQEELRVRVLGRRRRVAKLFTAPATAAVVASCSARDLCPDMRSLLCMSDEPSQAKIYVDLPEHWATSGEGLWAFCVGDDLYELDNVPFYAYGMNYKDIVRARPDSPDQKPRIIEVVERRGHHTLRFFFADDVAAERQKAHLRRLEQLGVSFERADGRLIAIDVPPQASYDSVCDELAELEANGILEYETCELRVPGRFDLDGSDNSAG